MPEEELKQIRKIARQNNMTVAEWVRLTLRAAWRREPGGKADQKLAIVRASARHAFPAPDINQMLAEIERGYLPSDSE